MSQFNAVTLISLRHLSPSSLILLVFLFITPSLSISHANTFSFWDKNNLQLPQSQGETILLVEDDASIMKLEKRT
jgi:hypothetical protein